MKPRVEYYSLVIFKIFFGNRKRMKQAGAKEGLNGATRRKGAKIPPIKRRDSLPIFSHLSLLLSLYHLPPPPAAANRRR